MKIRTLLVIAVLLQVVWGLVPSASQYVIREIPVEIYIALRWSISGLIFLGYLLLTRKFIIPALPDLLKVSLLGIFGYGVGSFGTLYGLKLGGVTNFALMGALNPLITSLVSFAVLKERPQKLFFVALPLCILGLGFLVGGKDQVSGLNIAINAAALIIGAAILEALTFTFSKRLRTKVGAFEYLAIAQLAAAVMMWLSQSTLFHQWNTLSQLSIQGIGAAVFVSVVACVFCYAILYWLLSHIDGHRLALFDGIHTLSATFFGWLIFHESLNWSMGIGGILLLGGLVVGNLPLPKNDGDAESEQYSRRNTAIARKEN